jgi:sialate O-acetylesterase
MKLTKSIVVCFITVASIAAVKADVKPARLFMDHMVIQRETQAPVWGWADAGEQVTVTGSWGESATVVAGEDGTWMVKLQTPLAGGPHTITIKGKNSIELKDVLSGDVWLCAGQSNMQMRVSATADSAKDIAAANFPKIRNFSVARNPLMKQADDCGGEWVVCSPAVVKGFSAVGYFTGRELHQKMDVPIGLLSTYWGGTCIEAWTPWQAQADDSFAQTRKAVVDQAAKEYTPEKAQAKYEMKLAKWERKFGEANQKKGKKKRVPRKPELEGDPRLNQNYPGNLYNGMVHPLAPFAVKGAIWYQGENNAEVMEHAEHYRIQLARMVHSWRKAWDLDFPFYAVQLPGFKAPQTNPVEKDNIWPVIRESFVHAANNAPDIYTCTMIDLGEVDNIHPKNKQDVGRRMASTILNKTYGQATPTTPFMKSFLIEDGKVFITFEYTGTGLVAKGGKLNTFAIAGADQKFVGADAEITTREGVECVVVSSAEVTAPVAVRYAWADNPVECNLFSKEGFPASPFRTDDWKLPASPPSSAK